MDLGMQTAVTWNMGYLIASANVALRRALFSAPIRMVLAMLASVGFVVSAHAQAPQEWTATGHSGTFPSESAALAAIRALGGRYALAEVIESVSVSAAGDKVSYGYKAKPRPLNIREWAYSGQYAVGSPFSSEEAALASALADLNSQHPKCGFTSIEVVKDWWLSQSSYGIPTAYNLNLKAEAAEGSGCSKTWTLQHFKRRTVECPPRMAYSGGECVANNIAYASTKLPPCDPCDKRGNPVSVTSGSKVQRESDFSTGWLDFYRTLNSSHQAEGGLGR